MVKKVVLKAGKEKSLLRQHPWIFSGAIASASSFEMGEVLPVYSHEGLFLAQAYFHPTNSLAGRVLSFKQDSILDSIKQNILNAASLRESLTLGSSYRLIHAEGDGLPGLIVDKYEDILVLQINTYGMERLKPFLIETLAESFQPRAIYEKSVSFARRLDGLEDFEGVVYGEEVDEVEIEENGLRFLVSIRNGQKTGFFFDQRNMRQLIGQHAQGKRVLNCFSYSGAFSLFALQGKASHVTSVDVCHKANALSRRNTLLNGFNLENHKVIQKDVFDFLKCSSMDYQLVILDPPAFAKKLSDQKAACLGYKALNRLALEKMPANSLLLTCSCSYHLDAGLFQNLLFQAAQEAGRQVKILSRHHQAYDHPVSLYHPEGEYLKSLLLHIN
jgi:23S rRNA (cytosine1962-C5)-methyltransferase